MADSSKRIIGALLIGAALIAGALLVRTYTQPVSGTTQEVAVVITAPSRESIKILDTNEDGVPDWQEALLVTEAIDIESTQVDYTAPDTLTEQFAVDFFQDIVRAKNYEAFGDTPDELVTKAGNSLEQSAMDVLLTRADIIISNDNSLAALAAYGESVATVVAVYSTESSANEASILEEALRNQSETQLQQLDGKITSYTNFFEKTKVIPVPSSVQKQHLDLLNSYQALKVDITAMRAAFNDPMFTLLRMKRYQEDATGLNAATINLYTALLQAGVVWNDDSVVYSLIGVSSNNR